MTEVLKYVLVFLAADRLTELTTRTLNHKEARQAFLGLSRFKRNDSSGERA